MTGTSEFGTDITPQVLLKAYACGIFPMAESADDNALYWIDPDIRGVLPLDGFHIPSRLKRTVRSDRFEVRIDTVFQTVMDICSRRSSTWINGRIKRLYGELFNMGHCHCIEVWQDDELAGGLYGLSMGGAFFGESMFSLKRDASKVALVHLAARLRAGGYSLLDAQFMTDHLKQFGAGEITREAYHERLEAALAVQGDILALPAEGVTGALALQVLSQTS